MPTITLIAISIMLLRCIVHSSIKYNIIYIHQQITRKADPRIKQTRGESLDRYSIIKVIAKTSINDSVAEPSLTPRPVKRGIAQCVTAALRPSQTGAILLLLCILLQDTKSHRLFCFEK